MQFDVKSAFLNGVLDEEIIMEQSEGFQDSTDRVYKLHKSFYGLKQSPRRWYNRFCVSSAWKKAMQTLVGLGG